MRAVFNLITTLALRLRALTLALVGLLLVLGIVSATSLNQELLPPVEFPQTIVLAQTNGMTSEQVLEVLTKRLEARLADVPEVVNLESTTTGSFGTVITVYNDFGIDPAPLRANLREAIGEVWLPQRSIETDDAPALIADLTPELILYFEERDSNFLFQLSTDVWRTLPAETLSAAAAYLADKLDTPEAGTSVLEQFVETEISPQLDVIDEVARVTISGGQSLPGENGASSQTTDAEAVAAQSLLLRLAPEVWQIISERTDAPATLDADAVAYFEQQAYTIPDEAPALPESWQTFGYSDASDISESVSVVSSLAGLLNDFYEDGRIVGALGTTDDLTPEIINRMVEIEPSLVQYFEAEHLVAMSQDVFDALPQDFIAGLDALTRDALAAKDLAQELAGVAEDRDAERLPGPWRIQPPQLIAFSLSDLPLAQFSIVSTGALATDTPDGSSDTAAAAETADSESDAADPDAADSAALPEGPQLPQLYALIGEQFGAELNTADDLIAVQLSGEIAEAFGGVSSIGGADFFNLLLQFNDLAALGGGADADGDSDADAAPAGFADLNIADFVPALNECGVGLLAITAGNFDFAETLISCPSADVYQYLVDNLPDFASSLQAGVYDYFSDETLLIEGLAPPLPDDWDQLAEQPQFSNGRSLQNADDLIALADGSPSQILNRINDALTGAESAYQIRLFDSLTPTLVGYFRLQEAGFISNLNSAVLLDFSREALASLPDDAFATLDAETAQTAQAIAAGEQDSAFAALRAEYQSDLPPADPNAPALAAVWEQTGERLGGFELDSADDFFRFPADAQFDGIVSVTTVIYDFAASFGNQLMEALTPEIANYILDRDEAAFNDMTTQALAAMPEETLAVLPESLQERAASGGDTFEATRTITRNNGNSSLVMAVYKDGDANTVTTYNRIEDLLFELDAETEAIEIGVIEEQSSQIEESITGVVREGSLGAVFAIIIILIFLSGGVWNRSGRLLTGGLIFAVGLLGLLGVTALGLEAAGGDFGQAFAQADAVIRVLFIGVAVVGVLIMLWPGKVPYPAWRATIVISVSIPMSIFTALVLMHFVAPFMSEVVAPLSNLGTLGQLIVAVFPDDLTLNIITLSGLTVAIGRVVDDSIVVLENIFRQMQQADSNGRLDNEAKKQIVLKGTRDVSSAIFTATLIAMTVFLPLGLTGGLIGAFFLPFGLSVTYALVGSFVVAITVVPVLSYLFISPEDTPEDEDLWLSKFYIPVLRLTLRNFTTKIVTIALAFLTMFAGFYLLSQRPFAFLPDFGEPQINVNVSMPNGTSILQTNERAEEFETWVQDEYPDLLESVRATVGGGSGGGFEAFAALFGGGGVTPTQAGLVVKLDVPAEELDRYVQEIRAEAEAIFGGEDNVTVSGGSAQSTGFGGLQLVVSGPQAAIEQLNPQVVAALEGVPGVANVSSNLSAADGGGGDDEAPPTFIRVNQQSGIQYSAELETEDTIGVTEEAIEAIQGIESLPDSVTVSRGFTSEIQTEGFASIPRAMGLALVIMIGILIVTFQSPVYWLVLILSIPVSFVGAAVALTITDRVLGVSALIGMLMLLGLVITNAVVLIDRVLQNRREENMSVKDALLEAGKRRLRPILMTSLATIIALIPLAIGLSEGAVIASDLGIVVIGGVFSSMVLTLVVVPVAYSLLYPLHAGFVGLFQRRKPRE